MELAITTSIDFLVTFYFPRSAVIPILIAGGINSYNLWNEHWEHWAHMPPLEERTEYPYQNIRVKNFPWGDGDKVRTRSCILLSMLN